MSPIEAYKKYTAIKLHFTTDSYDYFKYNGSVRTDESKFDVRKDKYYFSKLAKQPNLEMYLAVNFFENPKLWVGQLVDNECKEVYAKTEKNMQSLSYNFQLEMSSFENLNQALNVYGGEYPKALKQYKAKQLTRETMCILHGVFNVFTYWSTQIDDKIVWPRLRDKFIKYEKFMSYDREKFKGILIDMYE
jgi:hypothetical protein